MPDQEDSPEVNHHKNTGQGQPDQNQQFPGADLSKDNPPTRQQMELPGDGEYNSPAAKFRPKKSFLSKKVWIWSAILALVLLIGGLAWVFVPSKEQSQSSPEQNNQEPAKNSQTQGDGDNLPSQELTQSHTNDFLRLTLKYPKGWQISDENDVILLKSPVFSYQLADGPKEGFFKIYIKQQATPADGKYLGRGYAAAPSKKITYIDPQPGQRSDTFLTDFGLDSPDNFAYFVIQGNFELKKGETLGPKFAREPDAFLIAGGFASADSEAPLDTELLAVDSYASEQAYKTAIDIVKSLQLK
ncbi:hypothetical protein KY385_03405 [Candidatus Parcubacteria bacterium]|nr:hypothetical protein [Candidatus Parcubacteria bacterium]